MLPESEKGGNSWERHSSDTDENDVRNSFQWLIVTGRVRTKDVMQNIVSAG